ncbi:hypothetical protein FN846DRAFT_921760 [Sphaerosporella brunnea]|uniref:Uncharacterized protein n=1 Tax=Sphaerosporella brunnea TaxID=1250544 RepID=A0A5J5EMG7_9PEZI|nr:hypothetical protein FN846DRAFT_921760 [Sphaerosporella brunnea]
MDSNKEDKKGFTAKLASSWKSLDEKLYIKLKKLTRSREEIKSDKEKKKQEDKDAEQALLRRMMPRPSRELEVAAGAPASAIRTLQHPTVYEKFSIGAGLATASAVAGMATLVAAAPRPARPVSDDEGGGRSYTFAELQALERPPPALPQVESPRLSKVVLEPIHSRERRRSAPRPRPSSSMSYTIDQLKAMGRASRPNASRRTMSVPTLHVAQPNEHSTGDPIILNSEADTDLKIEEDEKISQPAREQRR